MDPLYWPATMSRTVSMAPLTRPRFTQRVSASLTRTPVQMDFFFVKTRVCTLRRWARGDRL